MSQLSLFTIFGAGLLTFASPCVLPLIPIYLSVLTGAEVEELRRGSRTFGALTASLAFGAGLMLVFVLLGLVASTAGKALFVHRTLLLQVGGLVVFLFGLRFLGYLKVPWLEVDARPLMNRLGRGGGVLGSFVFGASFALGWTPCVSPILGSVLMVAAGERGNPLAGAIDLAVYAAGIVLPLLAMAALAPLALHWHRRILPHVRKLEVVTGVLLAAFGLLLITDQLGVIAPSAVASPGLARAAAQPTGSDDLPAPGPEVAFAGPAGGGPTCQGSGEHGCALPDTPAATPGAAASLGAGGSPRLVEFVSRSCPVCQRMEPVLRVAENDCTGHGVKFVRVDVGDPSGRRAADEHQVRGVPTFLLLDAEGAEVARLVGEVPINVLRQSLEVVAGEKCDAFRPFAPAAHR
jgi:cytochrome c-type biogenesis protein